MSRFTGELANDWPLSPLQERKGERPVQSSAGNTTTSTCVHQQEKKKNNSGRIPSFSAHLKIFCSRKVEVFCFNELHLDFVILLNLQLIFIAPHHENQKKKKKKVHNSVIQIKVFSCSKLQFWASGNGFHPMQVAFSNVIFILNLEKNLFSERFKSKGRGKGIVLVQLKLIGFFWHKLSQLFCCTKIVYITWKL